MMNTFQNIGILAFCIFYFGTQAQTYQLTVDTKPFVYLDNPLVAVDGPWDVPEFQLPLGFDFELFDLSSDTIYSYFNSFGGIYEMNLDEDHLYVIIPFYCSLIDRGYQQDSALSPIHYKTEGFPGQQVFTLEFKEAGLFEGFETDDGVFLDYVSFQLKLYEENGDIEFHYGPYSTMEDPSVIFDPFPGPIVGLLADAEWTSGGHVSEIILLEGNPLAPTIATDTVHTFLDAPIPGNTVYRFSRTGTSVEDHVFNRSKHLFFPNPTSGELYLEANYVYEEIYPIIVLNVFGKIVDEWNSKADISVSDLAPGSYYLIGRTKNEKFAEKLLVLPK